MQVETIESSPTTTAPPPALNALVKLLPFVVADIAQVTTSSPFAKYAVTNYYPRSDRESREVKALLSRMELFKDTLGSVCGILNSAIDNLSRSITSHSRIVSAVARLPDDVLSEIFERCVPSHPDFQYPYRLTYLDVSHVCQKWRGAALNTPALWTMLQYTITRRNFSTTSLPLDLFRRSGALPSYLALSIRAETSWFIQHHETSTALDTVKGVDVLCTNQWPMRFSQISSWLSQFPNLRRLSLHGFRYETDLPWPETPPSPLRQLSHLHIQFDASGHFPTIVNVDATYLVQMRGWETLVSLTLERVPNRTLDPARILANLPNLVELYIFSDTPTRDDPGAFNEPVVHYNLQSFGVSVTDTQEMTQFFENLVLPGLINLGLCAKQKVSAEQDFDIGFLGAMLKRSGCHVYSLKFFFSSVFGQSHEASSLREAGRKIGGDYSIPYVKFHRGDLRGSQMYSRSKATWYI